MKIAISNLRKSILQLITSRSFTLHDAEIIADYLLWAEMSGNATQGLIKLIGTNPLQDIVPQYAPKVLRDTPVSRLIDGGANPAPLVQAIATDVAIAKASESGMSVIGVTNTFSSNGAQAYYAERIAEHNLIGIVCSRSPASTTGFGSIDPLFGTNPIAFSFPTTKTPLVFDMATSAMTYYGLILAQTRGQAIPKEMAIDSDGNPTTDPKAAMSGALLPFDGGHKGAGLGMVIELLTGPLLNGAWVDNETFEEEWGTTCIAIDPDILIDRELFKQNASDLVQKIKKSRRRAGVNEIRLPGERAAAARKEAQTSGYIEIEDAIFNELNLLTADR